MISKTLVRAFILTSFISATGCSGCSRPPIVAHFDPGLFFTSWEGNDYHHVEWFRKQTIAAGGAVPDKADPCPIVIHLQGNDLDEKKLVDRKELAKLGFKEEGGRMILSTENYFIGATSWNGVLSSVSAGLRYHRREELVGIISIKGQMMSLPISEEELQRLLGKPKSKTRVAG